MDNQASQQSGMKKEATVLNVICTVGAIAFLAFAAFNALSSGDFFTTDNLFLTLVCLLFALVLAVGPLLYLKDAGKLPLVGGVEKVRWRRVVQPGDELVMSVTLERLSARGGWGRGRTTVDAEVTCEARLFFALA